MVTVLTGIAALITYFELLLLIIRGGKTQNVYQVMMFILVVVCNTGYFVVCVSDTLGEAILGNNITYFGVIFVPIFVLLTICDLTDMRMHNAVTTILVILSISVLALACSAGHSDLYYKEVSIEKIYGATHIYKVSGPMNFAYRLLLVGEIVVGIIIMARAVHLKKNFTKRSVMSLIAVVVGPSIVYFLERLFDCPVELLPFAYVIVLAVYLSMESRMRMYDMSSSVASAYEKMDEYGFITFDLKKKLMNCNRMALNMMPDLKNAEIDESVKKTDSIFYEEIISWIDVPYDGEYNEKKIIVGNRYIRCTVRKIYAGFRKKCIGYCVELVDDTKQENYIRLLNNYNDELEKQVEEKTRDIRAMQESVITGMATMVESRDNSTGGHIRRTSEGVKVLAEALRKDDRFALSETFLQHVIKAAPMHDLGKIAVDDVVLRKPGRFTDEEYAIMKTHSAKGAEIVTEVLQGVQDEELVKVAVNVAHYHHEKWDGSGYPTGMKGSDIPIEARIMALADVFDALVSKRCYKDAFTYDRAFEIIEESLGSHFDPEIGKLFIECRHQLIETYEALPE